MNGLNERELLDFLVEACANYERTAPAVADYLDDLYRRIEVEPHAVTLAELRPIVALRQDDGWEHPNYAANRIYHARADAGQSTVGLMDH